MNLPNLLTILRMLFPLILIFVLYLNFSIFIERIIVLTTFLILGLTDFLDGYIARKLKIESIFGKIFDPISDKILSSSALLYILSFEESILIPSIIIISREFLVSGNREYMLSTKKINIDVIFLSKLKTSFQFISISMFLLSSILVNEMSFLYAAKSFLWFTTLLTIYTGLKYSYKTYNIQHKRKK